MVGAIAELARDTLRHEFRHIDTTKARVILVEGADEVLPMYPAALSQNVTLTQPAAALANQSNPIVSFGQRACAPRR